jgi:hypothetical protein
MLEKENGNNGRRGFHGMTPDQLNGFENWKRK